MLRGQSKTDRIYWNYNLSSRQYELKGLPRKNSIILRYDPLIVKAELSLNFGKSSASINYFLKPFEPRMGKMYRPIKIEIKGTDLIEDQKDVLMGSRGLSKRAKSLLVLMTEKIF